MNTSLLEQRSLIKYFVGQQKPGTAIVKLLGEEFGEKSMTKAAIYRWIIKFKAGRENVHIPHNLRSPRGCVITPTSIELVKKIVEQDRRLTVDEISSSSGISVGSVHKILHNKLKYRKKVCRWVPHHLNEDLKTARVDVCRNLITRYSSEGKRFIDRIITGDETWVYHYLPESKESSKQWVESGSSPPKKLQCERSTKKVMLVCFWDSDGLLVKHLVKEGCTVNKDYYTMILREYLAPAIREKRPHLRNTRVLLQQDNARPHTAGFTQDAIRELGWELLPHPPYSPDLAPSDYYLFAILKSFLRGRRFTSRPAIGSAIHQWSLTLTGEQFHKSMHQLPRRWRECIDMKGSYIEQ